MSDSWHGLRDWGVPRARPTMDIDLLRRGRQLTPVRSHEYGPNRGQSHRLDGEKRARWKLLRRYFDGPATFLLCQRVRNGNDKKTIIGLQNSRRNRCRGIDFMCQ